MVEQLVVVFRDVKVKTWSSKCRMSFPNINKVDEFLYTLIDD